MRLLLVKEILVGSNFDDKAECIKPIAMCKSTVDSNF